MRLKLNLRIVKLFSLVTSLNNDDRQFQHLTKKSALNQTSTEDELIILGSTRSSNSQAGLLEKKINELEKRNGIVEKLEGRYGFLLKNCFNLSKL